jgi:hypothetical protein
MKKALKLTLLAIRSLIISTIIVGTFAKIPVPSTLGWMDLGWQYRKPITVSNSGSTATNEDVLITVDTLALVNEGKLQATCNDLRFTDSDENTTLSYWIESGCNTTSTKIWTRIPSLPSGGKTIYMYYGNPTAVSTAQAWSGNVIMFADAACPTGWTRATTLDGKFLYGSATYGTTGGSNSHAHTDAISTSSSISTTNIAGSTSAGTSGTTTTHTHTNLKATVNSNASVQPPYKDAILCYSNKFMLTQGLVSMFNTTTPTGWTRFSALDGVFPKANTTYGTTGGSATHTHTTTANVVTGAATGTQNTITVPFSATGGTVTYSGGYTIHTFTSGGTFTANKAGSVEVLVVGGGGGGSSASEHFFAGGGGGGGGAVYSSAYAVATGGTGVTVGAGGAGNGRGQNGGNSVFSSLIGYGGGGGGQFSNGSAGGSGGGGGGTGLNITQYSFYGGAGSQGYRGGNALGWGAAGGGGMGSAGGDVTEPHGTWGGYGIVYSISGSSVCYAGGGGGGPLKVTYGEPGSGQCGGGNGGGGGSNLTPTAGAANTGGGGGGGCGWDAPIGTGASGGSGIVIVRYPTPTITASGTIASSTHTHTSASATVSTDSNLPPYLDMVFAKANSDQYATENNIIITSALPPLGWNRFTALDSKFTRGAATYGATGGAATHTHSTTITTGAPSATLTSYGTGANFANSTHTHSATVTSDAVSNLPAYTTVIYAQRKVSKTTVVGTESVQNSAPNAPSTPQTEGSDNPTLVSDYTPEFSAIFTDVDGDNTGNYYQIQVNTNSSFTGTTMWDSTKTSLVPAVANGSRSQDISYAGTALQPGTTYYWRMKFWDSNTYQNESNWSTTAQFTMNYAPAALNTDLTGAEDIYAGKTLTIQTKYSDPNGATDLDKLYLQIKNPAGTDIEYYITSTGSNQTNQFPTSVSGAIYLSGIKYDTVIGSPTANDITVTWHVTPNWNWIRGASIQYGVKALDKNTAVSTYSYTTTTYKYENRLDFAGTLAVTDSENNPITSGDWTSSNQVLTFSGIKVVYFGTTNIYPLDTEFDVKITNEESTEWSDLISTGENISIDITTANITNIDDTYTLSIANIPTGGIDASASTFNLKTDKTNPVISSLASDTHPNQSTWYTATTADIDWTISDAESGIESTWYIWDKNISTDLVTTIADGTLIAGNTISIENIIDGSSYLHLATRDNCGNTAFSTYTVNIDTHNPIIESVSSTTHSSQTTWYSNDLATILWESYDTGSDILGVWKLLDQNETRTVNQVLTDGTQESAIDTFITPDLADGIWYLHLVAQDNTGKTTYAKYTLKIDTNVLDIVAITGEHNNVLQNINSGPIISWTDPNSISDNTFYITNDGTVPTNTNFTYSTTENTYDLPAQKEGETIIKVRAMNATGTYSETRTFTILYDSVAPTNVSNFITTPSQRTINLIWQNPTASDFNKVVVVKNNSHAPTSITDETTIFQGNSTTYTDTNLNVSTRYYYTIFALDNIGNTSSGTMAQATTPAVQTIPTEPTTPVEPEPVIPTPQQETIVIKAQDLKEEQKVSVTTEEKKVNTTSNGEIHIFVKQTLDIEIPAETITDNTTDFEQVTLTVNNQTYNMTYNAERNTYKTTIDAPSVKGTYTTTIQAVTSNNTSNLSITMSLLVDPYGYIFAKSGVNEVRILNAKVTLYTKKNNTEVIWLASEGGNNPQYTNAQGEYQYFVTPGEYKLVIEATGYMPTETEWFTVESNIVEKNIELKKNPYLWFGIIAGIEIIAGIGIAIFIKKKKSRRKNG